MTKAQFQNLIEKLTDFPTVGEYRSYLLRLCADNAESGREATSSDYATMVALLIAFEELATDPERKSHRRVTL